MLEQKNHKDLHSLFCWVEASLTQSHHLNDTKHQPSQSSEEMPAAKQTLQKWTKVIKFLLISLLKWLGF